MAFDGRPHAVITELLAQAAAAAAAAYQWDGKLSAHLPAEAEAKDTPSDIMQFLHLSNLRLNTSSTEDMAALSLISAADTLKEYYTPVLVAFGLLSNFLLLFTINRSKLHFFHFTAYLTGLALVDIGFLVVLLILWLHSSGLNLYNTPGWCQGLTMAGYTFEFLAVWFVAGLALETILILRYPLGTGVWWPAWRPRILTIAMTLAAVVIYLNISLLFGVNKTTLGSHRCMPLREFVSTIRVLNEMDLFFNFIVAYILIAVLVVLIFVKVLRASHFRRLFTKRTVKTNRDEYRVTWEFPANQDTEVIMVKVTLSLALVFLVCGIPTQSLRIWFTIRGYTTDEDERSVNLSLLAVHHILLEVFFTRCALTFPACLAVWKNFRSSFVALCTCNENSSTENGNTIEITELETEYDSNPEREISG